MVLLPNMVGAQTHLSASPHSLTRVRTCTCTCTAASQCPPRRRELRAAWPTDHPSGSRHNRTHRARLRVVRQLSCRTSRCPTSSVSPPAHELPSTARPRLAVLASSCGLTAAHREHAVRQPAELFRALDGALTDFVLFPAPRYRRARARAAIGHRGEYGRAGFEELRMSLYSSSVSCISCCGSSLCFMNNRVWSRLAACCH